MNTRISHLQFQQDELSTSKKTSLFQTGVNIVNTILSLIVTAFAAIVSIWINDKQHEFDGLQDRSK